MPAPTITPLPTPPSRSQSPDTFSTDADAFLGALPDFTTEANDQADYLDALATQVDIDATAAVASAAIAASAANYQGDYNAGTTYQIGQSVSYLGRRYAAKTVNTGVTPVEGANWFLINDGDVLGPVTATNNALALYDGTTGKLLKSGLNNGTAGQVLTSGGSGNIPTWATPSGADLPRVARTSNTEIGVADKGKIFEFTANSFTQTFASAATLGNGWWCYLYNKTIPAFETSGEWTANFTFANANSYFGNGYYPRTMFMHPSGTHVYVGHTYTSSNRGRIFRFPLSTPFDITSIAATYDQIYNADAQIAQYIYAIQFKSDGTQMFLFARSSTQMVAYVYNLSTAWSLNSASYSGTSFTFDLGSSPEAACFSADGTKVYISNYNNVRQYNLGTAWSFTSVTTAHTMSFSLFASPTAMGFNDAGTSFFARLGYRFAEWRLSSPFNLSSATFYGTMSAVTGSDSLQQFSAFTQNRFYTCAENSYINYEFSLDRNQTLLTPMENQSGRDVTLDPSGSETIDGRASFVMYPGEMRIVYCDGSQLYSVPIKSFQRMYSASGTFAPPPGYAAYNVIAWAGGGGGNSGYGDGSNYWSGGGGGGGACIIRDIPASMIGNTSITVKIGAGGAGATFNSGINSGAGGTTEFGIYLKVYGGNGGSTTTGGNGGGYFANILAPAINSATSGNDGNFGGGLAGSSTISSGNAGASVYGGGGGGAGFQSSGDFGHGGNSIYGGGGGGGGCASNGNIGRNGGALLNFIHSNSSYYKYGSGGGGAYPPSGPTTLLAFGMGGGGGSRSDTYGPSAGANGGIAGGGGGGAPSGSGASSGGNGGNGFMIIQGLL